MKKENDIMQWQQLHHESKVMARNCYYHRHNLRKCNYFTPPSIFIKEAPQQRVN